MVASYRVRHLGRIHPADRPRRVAYTAFLPVGLQAHGAGAGI